MGNRKAMLWILWIAGVSGLTGYLVFVLYSDDRALFLIGQTTQGHHQIELACGVCHTSPFGGQEVLQQACVDCHGAELAAVNDSHPKTKFTDPRNADRTAILDARSCVTCHTEHRPGITVAMGLTMPGDYCFKCHETIGKERPSHEGLGYETCASAGCHNFHDNLALYEDFLVKHLHQPDHLPDPKVWQRKTDPAEPIYAERFQPALTRASMGPTGGATPDPKIVADWQTTIHAKAGVACAGCHDTEAAGVTSWTDHPGPQACSQCHGTEVSGFLASRHGMRQDPRLDVTLTAMTPALARIPMKTESHDTELGCGTCHTPHSFETRAAAVDACLGCHNDDHSLAYSDSPHAALWRAETAGELEPGRGVSCATCHLPRELLKGVKGDRVVVQHNQNLNLRPNEKMIRSVCLDCHGLGFAIDALADPEVVRGNFATAPSRHIESLDWAERRLNRPRN